MALMTWREANRAKWVGIRPAHYGEQIVKYAFTRTVTTIIHTVTAGKVFHWEGFTASYETAVGGANVFLSVRNGADVLQYTLINPTMVPIGAWSLAHTFKNPIEVPAGWDIFCGGSNAADGINAFIHGWEDDA